MGWQQEIAELVAYGRRIGLGFEDAWQQAVECVDVPPMYARAPRPTTVVTQGARGQLLLEVEDGESVLLFFKGVCRRAWDGDAVAPEGWAHIEPDMGGVVAIGKTPGMRSR